MAGKTERPRGAPCSDDGERRPHKAAARQRPPLRKRIVSVQAERGSYVGRGKTCQGHRLLGVIWALDPLPPPRAAVLRSSSQSYRRGSCCIAQRRVARVAQTQEVSVVWECLGRGPRIAPCNVYLTINN